MMTSSNVLKKQNNLDIYQSDNSNETQDSMVGKFQTAQDYLNAVKTLISSTQETEHRIDFFKTKILPFVDCKNVLDIGVGNGELSESLYQNLQSIDIVDYSIEALNSIDSKNFPNQEIKKFHQKIENFDFAKDAYDLIINSHTLYYIDRSLWKGIIQKSVKALKSEGYMIIVLNDSLGRSKLSYDFGAKETIKIEQLIEECATIKNISLQVLPVREVFQPRNLKEALEVVNICFYDIRITANKTDIIQHLNDHYLNQDGSGYDIDFIQYFFIIQKN